ncbi:MAG: hypothetical protein GYA26_03105 [Flexilinea flocculi]|nr:hypothetical protein [Flexilinea flocculi]
MTADATKKPWSFSVFGYSVFLPCHLLQVQQRIIAEPHHAGVCHCEPQRDETISMPHKRR